MHGIIWREADESAVLACLQELADLMQTNSVLSARVMQLQDEKQQLQNALEAHIAVCDHPFNFAEVFLNMP